MTNYCGTTQASKILGCSEPHVRQLADTGVLPCVRTESGRRMFCVGDVDALAAVRKVSAGSKRRRQKQ